MKWVNSETSADRHLRVMGSANCMPHRESQPPTRRTPLTDGHGRIVF